MSFLIQVDIGFGSLWVAKAPYSDRMKKDLLTPRATIRGGPWSQPEGEIHDWIVSSKSGGTLDQRMESTSHAKKLPSGPNATLVCLLLLMAPVAGSTSHCLKAAGTPGP